jgi:hypothetical protein
MKPPCFRLASPSPLLKHVWTRDYLYIANETIDIGRKLCTPNSREVQNYELSLTISSLLELYQFMC